MKYILTILALVLTISFTPSFMSLQAFAGATDIAIGESDHSGRQLIGFFDLRDSETFVQITNTDSGPSGQTIHLQLFNVGDDCNENNFFDTYTPNDTHVYNLRDIQTNDGNPSGVVLPSNAYGIVTATFITSNGGPPLAMLGNSRILDDNGYEYRTNLIDTGVGNLQTDRDTLTFNFNTAGGVTLSDVVGIALDGTDEFGPDDEIFAADIVNIWMSFDVDIYNLDEVPFSCRNVIFACVDQDNPLLEALLEESEDANVASFEYGINNAIPHSKGGELLCPGNIISEGFVILDQIDSGDDTDNEFIIFVGLNNGNGRGSMDSAWYDSNVFD